MLGITLLLTDSDILLIDIAINEYKKSLSNSEAGQYEATLNRIKDRSNKVDGLYMRCMENALEFIGRKKAKTDLSNRCKELATKIRKERESFQMSFLRHNILSRLGA